METLGDCLLAQQSEVEMLQAMYPDEDELHIDDLLVGKNHQAAIDGQNVEEWKNQGLLKAWSFSLQVIMSGSETSRNYTLSLRCSLPLYYPIEKPNVYVSSDHLLRESQGEMNKALSNYVENELPPYEQMVLPVIDWVRENAKEYILVSTSKQEATSRVKDQSQNDEKMTTFSMMWLYMHHIYNKEKRRQILQWAQQRNLCGFCLPGKPGVVYVEGDPEDVNDYFIRLRRLSWQKMSCKQRDVIKVKSRDDVKKFNDFREIAFDVHGSYGYHMDMGQFKDYLIKHDLEYIFKELFGM